MPCDGERMVTGLPRASIIRTRLEAGGWRREAGGGRLAVGRRRIGFVAAFARLGEVDAEQLAIQLIALAHWVQPEHVDLVVERRRVFLELEFKSPLASDLDRRFGLGRS